MTITSKENAVKEASANNVIEAAATWYVDLQINPNASLLAAHQRWLDDAAEHRQAWKRVERVQQTFSTVPKSITHTTLSSARISRREAIKNLSILIGVSVVGTGAWQHKEHLHAVVAAYKTATGE